MSVEFHQQLQQIITLSEQMLHVFSNDFDLQSDDENNESEGISKQLMLWSKEREALIKLTFNKDQTEIYNQYLPLINKMLELDRQLTARSVKNKNNVKDKVLKIKQNKKAANTYNKF